jgi:hypothetical protein
VTARARQVGATPLLELPLELALAAELEAGGVRGEPARDALRSILMCIAGFLVGAWRPDALVPPELRHATLWGQVSDEQLSRGTISAMSEPPELGELFETTLRAVVDAYVPDHESDAR